MLTDDEETWSALAWGRTREALPVGPRRRDGQVACGRCHAVRAQAQPA
jgi:hypothetical protein